MYLVRPPLILKKLYPGLLWRVETKQKKIFLSFDDGPHPDITPWVLDLLKLHDIRAMFFCVGENVVRYPSIYARLLEEGHLTGNHTYNHLNGWNTHSVKYLKNVASCAREVRSEFFRPPYGRMKKSQSTTLRQHYKVIMWDVLSGDFDRATSPEKCLDNTIRNSREGSIVVFHDSAKAWNNLSYVLPFYIEAMKQRGFSFAKLEA
jgi:peptidoglycan/xylan/chitin deacetylase (PgdA/CDA1 family)